MQLNFQDRGHVDWAPMPADFGVPYLSISVSLNILLTLMIVIRLVLHSRNIRAATGMGTNGLYKAISTMLIESCALFAVNSLLVIGPLIGGNYVAGTFFPILAETQVRAFPRSHRRGRLPDVDRTGDRPTAHHSTSRRLECVDGPHYNDWAPRFIQR